MRSSGRWTAFGLVVCAAAFGSLISSKRVVAQQNNNNNSSYNWSGFYAGGNLGGAFGGSDVLSIIPSGFPFLEGEAYPNVVNAATPSIIAAYRSNQIDVSSFTGGVQAGYNFWTGGLLVGVEADLNIMNAKGSKSTRAYGIDGANPPLGPTLYTFRNEIEANYIFTARPRVGVPVAGGLLYATGGVALTTLKYSHNLRGTGGFFDGLSENASASETKVGWTVGGGFELPLGPTTTLKSEYLFTDFGSVSTQDNKISPLGGFPGVALIPEVACGTNLGAIPSVGLAGPTPRQCFNHKADLNLHTIRMGLNFKF